jgi:hypothetical protein
VPQELVLWVMMDVRQEGVCCWVMGCWLCAVAGGVSVAGCTRSQCGSCVGVRLSGVAIRSYGGVGAWVVLVVGLRLLPRQ